KAMIRFTCPKCDKHLKAPEEVTGRHVRCIRCGNSFIAPSAENNPTPTWLEPVGGVTLVMPNGAAGNANQPNGSRQDSKRRGILQKARVLSIIAVIVIALGVYLTLNLLLPGRVDRAVKDLRASDPAKSKPALQLLSEMDPKESERTKVTDALETLLVGGDVHKNLDPALVLRVDIARAATYYMPDM